MVATVSVLMPCFNADRFVAEAVSSVLTQTYTDLELIVVDDGSTDRSLEVLKGFNDPRLRIIEQSNHGQCHAANTAFEASEGRLVKYFDADDVLSRDHIKRQVDAVSGRDTEIAFGEWARFYGDVSTDAFFIDRNMYRDADPVDWLTQEWMQARPMMQCALWLIPRPILVRTGGWDETLSLINDFEFFARVLLSAEHLRFTPGAKLYYRSGIGGSLSGRTSRNAVESAFSSLLQGTTHLVKVRNDENTRRACANVLMDFEYTYFPDHADLSQKIRARVDELGGSDIEPDGPPGFHKLRRIVGWKLARRIQRALGR